MKYSEALRITLRVSDVRRQGEGHVSETTYTMHIAWHISSWRVICVIHLRTKESDNDSFAGSEQESEQHPDIVHSLSGYSQLYAVPRTQIRKSSFCSNSFTLQSLTITKVSTVILLKLSSFPIYFNKKAKI